MENKIKNYLLSKQNKDGGWPLYFGGESNVSASVKAYYALKLSGVSTKEKLMKIAQEFILKMVEQNKVMFLHELLLRSLVKFLGKQFRICLLK